MATLSRAMTANDNFYRNSANGAIFDLKDGHWFPTPDAYSKAIQERGGDTLNGVGDVTTDLVNQWKVFHPSAATPVLSTADARAIVRDRYLFYLKHEPDAAGWDFWTNSLINLANAHGKESALAELNHAFTTSTEYLNLQQTTGGGSSTTGGSTTTTGGGSSTTTTATDTGIMAKIAALPTWVKIGGVAAALIGLSMAGGSSRR